MVFCGSKGLADGESTKDNSHKSITVQQVSWETGKLSGRVTSRRLQPAILDTAVQKKTVAGHKRVRPRALLDVCLGKLRSIPAPIVMPKRLAQPQENREDYFWPVVTSGFDATRPGFTLS